ncbi:hypothetical protein F5X71_34575 [Nocardia brasiliensis]|uniref:Gp28/Gp37-like domain-containing protein n=1 Tax=Nocardia brasiliensis TaxID=37326 RepID=A0A6G9Y459_NOCBR|nr:hypothetical protein F5X71_34575 [Nocardia brasiliensis]
MTDYISANIVWKRNATSTGTIVLNGDDPLGAYAMRCRTTVVPIIAEVNGYKWTGRVDTASWDLVDGVATYTLQLISDWQWFHRILVWPNFLLPIQFQVPKEAIYIGPACTVLAAMCFEQAIRLQLGLWEVVNNILNPAAWFATAVMKEGLLTPIAVVPINPLTDTSKWVAISGRMDTVATLSEQVCKDNGIDLSAEAWRPGDPQPCPQWYTLNEACVVVRIKDKSGVTGPTGTIVDGLIKEAVDIADGMLGEILDPFADSEYRPEGINLAPAFGVNWVRPWTVLLPDVPRSGIKECHITEHHPLAYTVVGGGRSPSWVNKIIDVIFELILSEILTVLGAAGISSTLLDGLFDNIILAFQQIENAKRRFKLGRFGFPEFFTGTGSTAYTLDEFFALEIAMWDTRGYTSCQAVMYDGIPYSLGRDYQNGDLMSWIHAGKLYTDYITEIDATDDRNERVTVLTKIGDGSAQESPWAKLQRQLSGFKSAMQIAMLSSN